MARFSLPFGKGKDKEPARPSWSPAPAPAASAPPAPDQASQDAQSPSASAPTPDASPWSPPTGQAPSAPSSASDAGSWLAPSGQGSPPDEPAPIHSNGGQNQEQNGQGQEQEQEQDTSSEQSDPERESQDSEPSSESDGSETGSDSTTSDWKKEAEAQGNVPESGREPVEPLSMQDRDNEDDQLSRTAVPPMENSGSDSQGDSDHDSDQDQSGSNEPQDDSERVGVGASAEDFDWEQPGEGSEHHGRSDEGGDGEESAKESGSRVSVVDEKPPRPDPPSGASEDEYKWHTYKVYPSGRPDAVEFIDTYKAFGKNRIIRGLNMGLPEGMVSMILGPSGTGKSVCIKMMVGLLYPDEGDILVHGTSVPNMPDDDLFDMRKKFGLLFQDGALFGSMNLYDNVAFPLRQHTEKSEDEIDDIVMRRLNEVGLGSAREKYPNELSGGMRKRAGFARALVLEPDIVLFDEPDSGLDPVRTALLGELILEIHRDMMEEAKEKQKTHLPTFAVITHDIMSARRVADYINVLWKGRIVEAGPAEDMLNSENPFIRQFLAGESQGPLTMD
jgi:phospholipid/cholesterol/gamma-HCH transport system ATP-binding protein